MTQTAPGADARRPVIMDCDPGHDDAVALYLALAAPNIDLLAVTTSAGNQTPDKTFANARNLLELAGRTEIPVAAGAPHPLRRDLIIAAEVHGDSGLDGASLPVSTAPIVTRSALDLQAELIAECPTPVTLVATGPLTNIAILLLAHPELHHKIDLISLMGGACFGGNYTPNAEFNIYVDPEAADIVFRAGLPIAMFGLDVTHRAQLHAADIAAIRALGTPIGVTMADLLEFYHRSTTPPLLAPAGHIEGLHMHDPCAMAYLIAPELFTMIDTNVQIVTNDGSTLGCTVVDHNGRTGLPANACVGFDVDQPAFAELVRTHLAVLG